LRCKGGVVDQQQFINFVRQRGLAVIATRGADGAPQAALVGITATGRGELVFDTSRSSRKYRNLPAFSEVALVIGWDHEMTVQCEGTADVPTGADFDRCRWPTSPSTRTAWNAPVIPTSCTFASAQAGCGTATTWVLHCRGDRSGTLIRRQPSDTNLRKRLACAPFRGHPAPAAPFELVPHATISPPSRSYGASWTTAERNA
jgi:hypothetical protein